jgi:hypothetical protein
MVKAIHSPPNGTACTTAEFPRGRFPCSAPLPELVRCDSGHRGTPRPMSPRDRPPDEGWMRFTIRQLFLGSLGLPGDDLLPRGGRLRLAALAFYVSLALALVVIVAALIAQR